MTRRTSSIETPVAHLVGPGKLKVINGRLAFSTGQDSPLRLDPATLQTVYCYGQVGLSDEAVQVLFQHGVQVSWMTAGGHRCRGRLVGAGSSGAALRVLQHQVFLSEPCRRDLARWLVAGKIQSQLRAARHYQRQGCQTAGPVLARLQAGLARCATAAGLDELRGIEGNATATWFGLLGALLRAPWQFTQRVRRPPTDPVNSLLSFGYTLLQKRTEARCEAAGLEVALGALHDYRAGRASLACDLVEPLRVPAVDRWLVRLCNEGHVSPDDFRMDDRAVLLQPEVLPRVLASWEEHWASGSHEKALDGSIRELVSTIRRLAAALPTPLDGLAESEGSGEFASDDGETG